MTRMDSARVKKYAKIAYTRFDMCVSTLFSPFAGVLYTVSALERDPVRARSRSSSRASSSRTSSRASSERSGSSLSQEHMQIESRANSIGSEESRPTSRCSQRPTEVIYCSYVWTIASSSLLQSTESVQWCVFCLKLSAPWNWDTTLKVPRLGDSDIPWTATIRTWFLSCVCVYACDYRSHVTHCSLCVIKTLLAFVMQQVL